MNHRIVIKVSGIILIILSVGMIPSFFVSLLYREASYISILLASLISLILGFAFKRIKIKSNRFTFREGLAIVGLGWFLASIIGSLPFVFSGYIPNPIDAFFEAVSGFTTTGASILTDIEAVPKGILFWRSFTHWLGGVGILVFAVALMPSIGIGSIQIIKAESSGPTVEKITHKISDNAKILYVIYIVMTVSEIILLLLGGMNLYDAFVHTFATVGTGGFSVYNQSIAHYNSTYIDLVISIFMFLSGSNFAIYYALYKGRWRTVFKDDEYRFYFMIIFAATGIITLNLLFNNVYDSIGSAIRYSFFQVSSITTETGFATANFDQWPTMSKFILFILMFIGGCTGSTSGGIKSLRIVVALRLIKREFTKKFHPHAMIPIRLNNKPIPTDSVSDIFSFIVLYLFTFIVGTFLLSFDNISLMTAASAVAACIGNTGPGFDVVGPAGNYSSLSNFSTSVLSIIMLVGRLELFTVYLLFIPAFWKQD